MPFLDLHEGILASFADACVWAAVRPDETKARRQLTRTWPSEFAKRYSPKCARCGVATAGTKARRYCSRKCIDAAKWARWSATNAAEHNARRRAVYASRRAA